MKVHTLDQLFTPSEMDMAKQYWRHDVNTWREKFRAQMPHDGLSAKGRTPTRLWVRSNPTSTRCPTMSRGHEQPRSDPFSHSRASG